MANETGFNNEIEEASSKLIALIVEKCIQSDEKKQAISKIQEGIYWAKKATKTNTEK